MAAYFAPIFCPSPRLLSTVRWSCPFQAKDAINIPLDQISNGEPVDLPDDREAPIVCVCNRGVDSLFALMLLKVPAKCMKH